MLVDLGAERLIAAQRDNEKIAVEIKGFTGPSAIHEMQMALGQYITYLDFLELLEPERRLYLAVSDMAYDDVFSLKAVQMLVQRNHVRLIVVNAETEEVVAWKN